MKIIIKAVGKFNKTKDKTLNIACDLISLAKEDLTLNSVIDDAFEIFSKKGCTCSFNESTNHCEFEGYEYIGEYEIISMEKANEK